ncbi:response regulator [Pelosinus baikalensis]|nr:response regulator [Pelosinus baikalensis]
MTRINVAIIDTNQEFISRLTRYLDSSKDILVVSTVTKKSQALKLPEIYDIDIMLIDINLGEKGCEGISVANEIVTSYFQKPKLIMLTNYNDEELVRKSFIAGAVYYILKSNYKMLPVIIRQIHNNDFPIESVIRDYADLMKDKILKSKFLLSDSEIAIYKLAEKGGKKSKIIEDLYISESTYKKHVNSILKKIKSAKNIRQAVEKFKEYFVAYKS